MYVPFLSLLHLLHFALSILASLYVTENPAPAWTKFASNIKLHSSLFVIVCPYLALSHLHSSKFVTFDHFPYFLREFQMKESFVRVVLWKHENVQSCIRDLVCSARARQMCSGPPNKIESVEGGNLCRCFKQAIAQSPLWHMICFNFLRFETSLWHLRNLHNRFTCNTQSHLSYLFTRSLQSKPLSGLAQQFWRLQACCKRSLNRLNRLESTRNIS